MSANRFAHFENSSDEEDKKKVPPPKPKKLTDVINCETGTVEVVDTKSTDWEYARNKKKQQSINSKGWSKREHKKLPSKAFHKKAKGMPKASQPESALIEALEQISVVPPPLTKSDKSASGFYIPLGFPEAVLPMISSNALPLGLEDKQITADDICSIPESIAYFAKIYQDLSRAEIEGVLSDCANLPIEVKEVVTHNRCFLMNAINFKKHKRRFLTKEQFEEGWTKESPDLKHCLSNYKTEECNNKAEHPHAACLNYHLSSNDRRRKMMYSESGWNYYPIPCKNSPCTRSECLYSHNKFESDYHFLSYKTTLCTYPPIDSNGTQCALRGELCPFAHSLADLRGLAELYLGVPTKKVKPTAPPKPNVFDLETYKTDKCKQMDCDPYKCICYHNSLERRRLVSYEAKMCPNVFRNNRYEDPKNCPKGDSCNYCHTKNELYYHPQNFRKKRCTRDPCRYGPEFCPDIHESIGEIAEGEVQRIGELYSKINTLKVLLQKW